MEAYCLVESSRHSVESFRILLQPVGGSQRPTHHPQPDVSIFLVCQGNSATLFIQLNPLRKIKGNIILAGNHTFFSSRS